MSTKLTVRITVACLATLLLPAAPAQAQSAFSNAVANLNPAAYWPLQETAAPPAADVEPNLGSLGVVANAYYSSTNVSKGAPGAITGGSDTAVFLRTASGLGSFLAVPTTDPRVSLSPGAPFSVEVWVYPTNASSAAIISQTGPVGTAGLNGHANAAGWSLNQAYMPTLPNAAVPGWTFHVFNGVGPNGGAEVTVALPVLTLNVWYHVVGVFDGVNATLYVNGTNAAGLTFEAPIPISGAFVPDTWDPLTIGCGRGLGSNPFGGSIDEVAIYPTALSALQVSNHYYQAITAGTGDGPYVAAVQGDSPLMYWRMDAPVYTAPTSYPVVANYGSASAGGLSLSGTTPGVDGPAYPGMGSPSYACAFNGVGTAAPNGVGLATNGTLFTTNIANSGVLITNLDSALNLRSNNISAMVWFKGNPVDVRFQGLIGHGDSSWRLALDGTTGKLRWNPGEGGEVASSRVYNDGNWHFVVGVYTNAGPASPAGWLGTNSLYVDGVLDGVVAITNVATTSTTNVLLGGSPDYARSGNGGYRNRFFAGSLAHAAYFTNALTADQVQALYNAAQPPPTVLAQPATPMISYSNANNTFTVVVSGASALAYQWYSNTSSNYAGATALTDGGRIAGSATTSLTISALQGSDAGYYFVIVTNNYGAVTSVVAQLTVNADPVIVAQTPGTAFTLYVNQSYTLSVTAGGAGPFTYQWFTNEVADTSPAGAGSTYALAAVQLAMSGSAYRCQVTDGGGSVSSTLSTLTVLPPPANSLSAAILALNPEGYWPMHETASGGPADVETNLGSLGILGNAYYADWAGGPAPIIHQAPGALVGSSDTCVALPQNPNGSSPGYLIIPRTSPATALQPPFTLEAWAKPFTSGFGDIISQGPWAPNSGQSGTRYGVRLSWGSGGGGATSQDFALYIGPGTGTGNPSFGTGSYSVGQWHHVAATFDGTTWYIYVDGQQAATQPATAYPMGIDLSSPIVIGSGLWQNGGQRAFPGAIDEVAIYPTALSATDILNHYNNGINPSPSPSYDQVVLANNPIIYLRMNAPAYTAPPVSTWPVLNNYGKLPINGVYSPGSRPGAATGGMFGASVVPGNGISSFADAGYDPAFNPTTVPFSYGATFRGTPADPRNFQTVMGHSDSGWRAAINSSGKLQVHGSGGPDLTSPAVYNDGNWHQFFVVGYPSNTVSHVPGTNLLYVDGSLVASNLATSVDSGSTTYHVMLGDDPQYTNNPIGPGRSLAGSVCEAAFWNNRLLSLNDVRTIWSAAGIPPYITGQPVTGRNVNGGAGTYIYFGVVANGSTPLSYQWYFNTSSNYSGATRLVDGPKYTNSTALQVTVTNLTDTDSGYYFVVVTNNYGSVTSRLASLTVFTSPIISSWTPVTYTNFYTLFAGCNPTFAMTSVRGAAPIFYYWYTNGALVSGATNASLTVTNVQIGWLTNYCVLSNFVGMTTSYVWTASVVAAPPGPYPQSVLSLKPIAYLRLNEPDDAANDGNPGAIAHDYAGGNNGIYTNTYLGQPGYSTGLGNQYGNPGLATDPTTTSAQFGSFNTVDSAALSVAGIDFATPNNASRAFSIEAWANGNSGINVAAGIITKGYGNGGEQFNLDTGSTSSHAFRFFVRNAAGSTAAANSSMAPDGNWHHLVGVCDEPNGVVNLYIDGLLRASGTITPGSGILSATNLMSIGARKSSATSANDAQFIGFMNDVAIYNYALSASQVASNYSAAGVAPQISQQPPASVSVAEGDTLIIPAAAIGTEPLAYQWQDTFTLGSMVSTQTTATLIISNAPFSLNGDSLSLTVTNIYGTVNSLQALVTVVSGPPQIVASNLPPQVLLPLGKSYSYSVDVTGTLPFSYQWYNGGVPVTGATNRSYAFQGVALGNYTVSVIVTNIHGTVTGSSALTVVPYPNYALANSVVGLGAVGYWPLQETVAPAPVTLETNLGTLGRLGNAFYAMNAGASPRVAFGQPGVLGASGDNDPAVAFTGPSGTNYAFVPHYSPALTMQAPLTYEVWLYSASTAFCDIMGQGGSGLNTPVGSSTNWSGIRLSYGGNNGGGPNLQVYAYTGGNNTFNSFGTPAGSLGFSQWHHCVMTFDETACILYIDGQPLATNATVTAMVPDVCSPLTIAEGRWLGDANSFGPTRSFNGTLDEVAVYTNVLGPDRVAAHYVAGTTTTASNYVQAVQADHPLLYYRMDARGYVTPDPANYPIAVNYGSAPANGSYPGGVVPGGLPGPSMVGVPSPVAAPINGVVSCIDAGNDPTFNPTGHMAFSAMLCFKGYPSDGRVQTLMSHGVQNWAMNLDGGTGRAVWNLYNGGQVTSTNILNDGNWHMLVGVSDGTTSSLYVDGVLNSSGALIGGLAGEPGVDLFLGGNADYTSVGINQRYFAGAISQAALFTNALTAPQVASLYSAAVLPSIRVSLSGGNAVLTYSGTLWSSTNAAGPFFQVQGAQPPTYSVPATEPRMFYRTSNP